MECGHLHLPRRFHFTNLLDTLHALGQLRFIDNARFAGGLNNGLRFVHTVQIGGTAQIFATVFGIYPAKVHGHISEIVNGSQTIFYKNIKVTI